MKWILGTLAVLAMLLIGTMISLPFVVSSETVRNGIITTIQDLTGRTVSFSGDPAVTTNPFLGIEITNLIVEDEKSGDSTIPLFNVERMQAKLDLLPALIGNV
ncbi:MAG: AsmA family protein, partial [Nitratireductor sp.]